MTTEWCCEKCGTKWISHVKLQCPSCFSIETNPMPKRPPLPQLFLDAAALISGPRRESYGDYEREATLVATGWSAITSSKIEARHVPMMMIWLKLMREAHKPGQDNRNDAAGYLALLDQMTREKT